MTSETRRHRHPDYPSNRCGLPLVVLTDGRGRVSYQQGGVTRRTCPSCRKRIRPADLR